VGGLAAGCGSTTATLPAAAQGKPPAAKESPCRATAARPRPEITYAAVVRKTTVARRRPGGAAIARFGPRNANGAPTVFGVLGPPFALRCAPAWLRVQLPIRPNGIAGYVRTRDVRILSVPTRIEIDISKRRVTLFRRGKRVMTATAAVGSPATPTPTGRYYVNQRLLTDDVSGPYGPGAIGISAYSNVLTGWTQGGPIAIHGTNQPWSIGHPVSNGCVRLPNSVLRRMFAATATGTPVAIHA
jgi:lipoprotein-anchoring transpeptidase ErfK/SrfK